MSQNAESVVSCFSFKADAFLCGRRAPAQTLSIGDSRGAALGLTIRKPLVSALCSGSSQSLFPTLSQRVGTMKLSCVTPTQQQRLLSFRSQSIAISVSSASVYV